MSNGIVNTTDSREGASSQKWKVVHTEASLGWGGQEIRIFREMQAMRERGHTCTLAAQRESRILEKCREAGFETFIISERPIGFPLSIIRLALYLRRFRPDVVNTHSSKDGWIGGIAARLAGVPLLIRSRHIEVDYPSRRRSRIAFGRLPDHVLTTSERIRGRLIAELDLEPGRVTCVPTGIDMNVFREKPVSLRHEWGVPEGVPTYGMISVLRSWKGHRFFIEALKMLKEKGRAFRAVIAGEGPGQERIESLLREHGLGAEVSLLGHREDVPRLLGSLDALVLPSTGHEGIPQIILQAHAAACPVIATSVGGIPEVVQDGITGRLVEPENSPALAQALIDATDRAGESTAMADRGRILVQEHHTTEVMCRTLEALYASPRRPQNASI